METGYQLGYRGISYVALKFVKYDNGDPNSGAVTTLQRRCELCVAANRKTGENVLIVTETHQLSPNVTKIFMRCIACQKLSTTNVLVKSQST